MFKLPPSDSPTFSQSSRRMKLLVHKNIFRQQYPTSVEQHYSTEEGHCCRKTFSCTNSFVCLLDRPVGEERGSSFIVCTQKKQCLPTFRGLENPD